MDFFRVISVLINFGIWILAQDYTKSSVTKDVKTTEGTVRGFVVTEDGYDYLSFLGIPYATPPLDKFRFKPPLPPKSWKGVLYANRTVKCSQNGEGDEDCLILNVFTPLKTRNHVPVLVYIHGGSFVMGSAQTSGFKAILEQDVVVVTINYRLGVFGFLCLGIEEAPGNAGLKDQIAALKWVIKNIKQFNGDPNKVTVYGMSAGGASVEHLVLSPLSKGLFQQAIVESGSATAVWAVDAKPFQTAFNLLSLGSTQSHSKEATYELLDFLMQMPAKNLSKINMEYYESLTDGTFGFVPCIEREIDGVKPFLSEPPHMTLKNENFDKVPVMFIYAEMEGLFLRSTDYYELNYKDRMNSNFSDFVPANLGFQTEELRNKVTDVIRKFYFEDKPVGDNLEQYLNYFGDYLVVHGVLNSVLVHSRSNNPVYLMEFAYKGQLGSEEEFYNDIKLAGHGDAVKYVLLRKPLIDQRDKMAVSTMTQLVSNFMRFGNPTSKGSGIQPTWPAVSPKNVSYLRFDNSLDIHQEPLKERKAFWDDLYNQFGIFPKPVGVGLV